MFNGPIVPLFLYPMSKSVNTIGVLGINESVSFAAPPKKKNSITTWLIHSRLQISHGFLGPRSGSRFCFSHSCCSFAGFPVLLLRFISHVTATMPRQSTSKYLGSTFYCAACCAGTLIELFFSWSGEPADVLTYLLTYLRIEETCFSPQVDMPL